MATHNKFAIPPDVLRGRDQWNPDTHKYEPPPSKSQIIPDRSNVMRHKYMTLTDKQTADMTAVKDAGLALHSLLDEIGSSREISLAKTKVEEAVMWAVKAITG